MFGGRFNANATGGSYSPVIHSERESRKQMLKDEISKCMKQLELDENNNPNNATSVTIKSEAIKPRINQEKHGIDGYNGLAGARASFDAFS